MEGASFGAGRAGAAIDPVDFLKQPQTLLRVTTWVRLPCAGRHVRGWQVNSDQHRNPQMSAVPKGDSWFCLPLREQFRVSEGEKHRSCLELQNQNTCSPAGFLAFLWFVAFCFLANQWQRTTLTRGFAQGADAARAAITFSFFSIIIWVVLALRALQRYRLGTDMSLFATEQFGAEPSASYPGYPGGSGVESTETYQSPPFSESLEANPKGYQVPAY
uniref:Synaptogyrin 3 n=1 Tax=Junco hyemalis TaxID=40217 RepID=A0A8C5IIK8_JUNHY